MASIKIRRRYYVRCYDDVPRLNELVRGAGVVIQYILWPAAKRAYALLSLHMCADPNGVGMPVCYFGYQFHKPVRTMQSGKQIMLVFV